MKIKWILLMIVVSLMPHLALASFSDVSDYQWKSSVEFMKSQNIVKGYSDGSYKPNKKINRAEFTKIIIGAVYEGVDENEGEGCFSDVQVNDWFSSYVCLAKSEGILKGYSDGTFRPNQSITQPEALKIIFKALGEETQQINGEWYEEFLNHADWLGMFYFNKDNASRHEVTRGEMAYFISWLLNEGNQDQIKSDDFYENDNGGIDGGEFVMTADDCVEGEQYDEEEKVCYYECYSDEECSAIGAKIEAQLAGIYEAGEDYKGVDEKVVEAIQSDGEGLISTYKIEGDKISLIKDEQVKEDLKNFQLDKQKHQVIWSYFTRMIPQEFREDITEFQVFTDGKENTLAAVTQTEDDLDKWVLLVDIMDAFNGDTVNKEDLTYSLIHEFGHVLTLRASQVKPVLIFDEAQFEAEKSKCYPQHFIQEGCTLAKSYINLFFKKFWAKIFNEWGEIQSIEDEDRYYQQADAFFNKYKSYFVTDYAATNLGEDIAEVWTTFILKPKPVGSSVADQKVQFFYDFPELVKLKSIITQRLAH